MKMRRFETSWWKLSIRIRSYIVELKRQGRDVNEKDNE